MNEVQRMIKQLEECRQNNCPDCYKCVWCSEALSNKPTKLVDIKPIETKPLEYTYDDTDHPLLKGFIEKFHGKII